MLEIPCYLVVWVQNIYHLQSILAIFYKFKRIFTNFGQIFSPKKKILWSTLIKAYFIYMCLGNTSVSCERGFSTMKYIKGLNKAQMKIEMCAIRMRIKLNLLLLTSTKPCRSGSKFDFTILILTLLHEF